MATELFILAFLVLSCCFHVKRVKEGSILFVRLFMYVYVYVYVCMYVSVCLCVRARAFVCVTKTFSQVVAFRCFLGINMVS